MTFTGVTSIWARIRAVLGSWFSKVNIVGKARAEALARLESIEPWLSVQEKADVAVLGRADDYSNAVNERNTLHPHDYHNLDFFLKPAFPFWLDEEVRGRFEYQGGPKEYEEILGRQVALVVRRAGLTPNDLNTLRRAFGSAALEKKLREKVVQRVGHLIVPGEEKGAIMGSGGIHGDMYPVFSLNNVNSYLASTETDKKKRERLLGKPIEKGGVKKIKTPLASPAPRADASATPELVSPPEAPEKRKEPTGDVVH